MSRKMRRLSIKPAAQPNADINVTPLIDIVLVMLIIFMVVTPLLEKSLDVRVPDTEKVELPTEVPPDQIVVRLSDENKLRINFEEVSPEEYVDKLRSRLDKRKPDDRVVFFISDEKANYGRLVGAFDGARQAGAKVLGMMTTPPDDDEKK
jgi:biopolymer transport protein ExbD